MPAERLQKVMAAAGIGSRRTCETLISEGRVQVNGRAVTELGAKADPARDRITVDGKPLVFQAQHVYYKVHKPRGVISDIGGDEVDLRTGELRRTVDDLLPPGHPRVFPVGRLDLHSEGLVLLTDDGELANRLTHPRYQHPKTYYVLLGEQPSQEALVRLRNGVDLPEGRSAPAEVMIVGYLPATLRLSKGPNEGVWLRVVLREGKKRQIRHMTAAVGYPTLRLLRWAIGPLTLGDLELGQARALTTDEINALRKLADLPAIQPPRGAARSEERGESRTGPPRSGPRSGSRPGPRSSARPGSRPEGRTAEGRTGPNRTGAAGGGARSGTRSGARSGAGARDGAREGMPGDTRKGERGSRPGVRLAAGKSIPPRSSGQENTEQAGSGQPQKGPPRRIRLVAAAKPKPERGGRKPPAQGGRATGPDGRPASQGRKPSSSGARPPGHGNRPASPGGRPAGQGRKPPGSGARPTGQGERPANQGGRASGQGSRPAGQGGKTSGQGGRSPRGGSAPQKREPRRD
jgi:23S rRNA pseudouridine2605 synthase